MKFAALAGALLSLAVPAVAQAETLTLDMHDEARLKAQTKLVFQNWYVVTVEGTGSFHYAGTWSHPERIFKKPGSKKQAVVCGTPEAAPMFASPGTKSGPVGFDAETMFARPVAASVCADEPGPRTSRRFEINDGNRWFHPTTMTGRHSSPRADHTYSYAIFGENHRPSFRVRDNPNYDNYGQFKIRIRQAYAEDCGGRQWRNFLYSWGGDGFADEAACVAALPSAPQAT
jgi:hypothetical protein